MVYVKHTWRGFDALAKETGILRERLVRALILQGYLTRTPFTEDSHVPACEYTITPQGASEGWLDYHFPSRVSDYQKYVAFITLDTGNEHCSAFLDKLSPKRAA